MLKPLIVLRRHGEELYIHFMDETTNYGATVLKLDILRDPRVKCVDINPHDRTVKLHEQTMMREPTIYD